MLVVVGGHSRDVGKTSVMASLIRALPQWNWTALKITQFGHGICSAMGQPCSCTILEPEHPYAITEEQSPNRSDTGRYLAAGARRSFWVRTAVGQLGNAVPAIREILAQSENTIVESNSLLQFFQPDLFLMVLDFAKEDFKPSSLRFIDRADAFIVIERGINVPLWKGVSRGLWDHKPQFPVRPPRYVNAALSGFVNERLSFARGTR